MEIVIKITESEVKGALGEYGYEVTPQRIAEIMETIAASRYVDTDEIVRHAIETVADDKGWQTAKP